MEGVPKEQKWNFEAAMFFGIWGYVLIALPALFMSIMKSREKKEIFHNQTFEIATIDGIEEKYHTKTGTLYLRFHYHYQHKNRLFRDDIDYKYKRYFVEFTGHKRELIKHKKFPVILSSKDPSKHHILIFWSDFSKYNLPFPDSLKWSEKLFYNK
jgi:hypothetical protein